MTMHTTATSSTDTNTAAKTLKAIVYSSPTLPSTSDASPSQSATLRILDQLLLPFESVYESISNVQQGWAAIREMKVRGGNNHSHSIPHMIMLLKTGPHLKIS